MQQYLFEAPYAPKIEDYREQEKQWASRLCGLSLVCEAGFDVDESRDAFRFVFRSYQRQSGVREDRIRLLRRYPASLLAGLTNIASSQYDEGTFWPRVGEAAGAEITQVHQTELSDGFRHGLDCFFLTRFDTPLKNVGEILMHAGIPAHSIDDFLHLLNDRSAKRPGLTGEDFCEWVGGLDRLTAASKGVDAPTWRFLKESGEFAIDLTDRFLTFLDAATAGQSSLAEEALDTIPPVLARAADEFLRLGGVRSAPRSRESRRGLRSPQIVYAEGQVQVRLPALDAAPGIKDFWSFSTSGHSWQRPTQASWMERTATTVLEPLTRPIADVVIQHGPPEREWRLGVVDRATDLMAFDQNTGRLIPPTSQLPASWIWLAFPANDCPHPVDALEIDGDLDLIEQADTPYGWKGWCFAKVDLSAVRKLRLKTGDLRWRFVSTIKQPMLKLGDPVPYVHSAQDSSIYSTRPILILPPVQEQTGSTETPKWRVQVVDASGETIVSKTIDAGPHQTEVDPWDGHSFGLISEFELRVTRVLGQGARFGLAIAEGLEATATPEFRSIDRHGELEPALVSFVLGNWNQEVRLGPADIAKEIMVDSDGPRLPLRASVDHMWLDLQQAESLPRRATSSLSLEIEKLDVMVLRVRLPPAECGRITLLSQQSAVGQEYIAGDSNGFARIPLSRFHDTAQRFGGGELYYESNGKVSLIGRIRPRKLISDVTVLSGCIAIERLYENLDLQIQLRLDNAPWLRIQPLRLPPGERSMPLPDIVDGRGPLTIAVQPFDPWGLSTVSSEEIRDRENEFHLDAETDFLRDSLEDRFIHWVAGVTPIPDDRGGIEFALDAYSAIRRCRPQERADSLASDVAQLTEKVGPRFLAVAASSQWSQPSHTRLLVEGWPATAKTMAYPVNSDLWLRSPYLGLVLSLGYFGEEGTSSELIEQAGNDAWSILMKGCDPAIRAGTFGDPNVDELADKPREIQDRFWKNYLAVPGRCLDEEQRVLNARTLFDRRSDARLHALIKASPTIVDEMLVTLEREYGDSAAGPLNARKAPKNWRQLPQTSLALAFAARMTARGGDAAEDIHRFARKWYADLADCAPGFVEQDLVLAELWITHWERR